jgi:hypothetical protein
MYIIKQALKHWEAENYHLKEPKDVIKFGLKLVKKYFDITDPLDDKTKKLFQRLDTW